MELQTQLEAKTAVNSESENALKLLNVIKEEIAKLKYVTLNIV